MIERLERLKVADGAETVVVESLANAGIPLQELYVHYYSRGAIKESPRREHILIYILETMLERRLELDR